MSKFKLACGAAVALVLSAGAPAWAQQRSFNIPAQDAAPAISAFGRQAGLQVIAPADGLQGVRTPAVSGPLDVRAALHQLIDGTGLQVASDSGGVIVLTFPADQRRTASGAAPPAALETVIVTAQRRSEAAQSVPITMTALDAATLQANRVENVSDLSRLAPGLLVSTFSEDSPTIAIRGASNTFQQIGVSKPVAIMVDDVFVERPSASVFKLFDVSSINILEGPQGTLFGRNVSGGAIVIETQQPRLDAFHATVEATGGNYADNEYSALVNLPLSSVTAATVSANLQNRDGYGQDRLNGAHEDGINSQNFRGNFLYTPTPDLRISASAHYNYDQNNSRTLSSTSTGSDGDNRTSELGLNQYFHRTLAGESLRAVWDPEIGTFTSISAYEHVQSGELYSGVAASYTLLATGQSQSVVTDKDQVGDFTQELRYASPKWAFGDFVAGFFYLHEDGERELLTNGLAAKTGALASSTLGNAKVLTDSYAGFADATVHLLPTLDLAAGVRYTLDHKLADFDYFDFVKSANNFTARGSTTQFGQATPRAVLNWKPLAGKLFFVSVSQGFTAGGFNTNASSAKAFGQIFQPEVVTDYEIGAKTQWWDNRLRVNASLFEEKFHDKQELVQNSLTGILDIVNAANATSKGLETTVALKPIPWLELTAGYTYLDAKYDSFVLGSLNNTGHALSSSPRNRATFDADVDYPLGGAGYLVAAANYSWVDNYNTGAAADPRLIVPSYGLTNMSAGYETPDRRYRATVWVRNLTDQNYILTNSTQVITGTYLGEPRTYGVTLRAQF